MPNPLKQTYWLGNQANIVTTITGDNRDIATIMVNNVNTPLWGCTLNSVQTEATTPFDIVIGSLTIYQGASFSLTIPSPNQKGMVTLTCELKSGANPKQKFSAAIAQWDMATISFD